MAEPPEKPKKPRDPAKPTRAKAAREQLPPLAAALAELLNPGIGRGTSGVGSQTDLAAALRSGLQPPADNSFDRRADFSAAHKARASTPEGFNEAPQSGYVGKSPQRPVAKGLPGINAKLAQVLGYRVDDEEAPDVAGPGGVAATAQALETLLREGRQEFRGDDGQARVWTPHRPPRPEKTEGGFRLVIK